MTRSKEDYRLRTLRGLEQFLNARVRKANHPENGTYFEEQAAEGEQHPELSPKNDHASSFRPDRGFFCPACGFASFSRGCIGNGGAYGRTAISVIQLLPYIVISATIRHSGLA